ncbi:hypothetical protein CANINC_003657 [Pichia inconspicua]|uniref:Uncharacterized protein n=1 Tax=Pichia inconspicua TaxID=52247 RepID=A0A4T0WY70_9ASCO|nr:hypothetical protein CANINC_003657 [[Candida] inconspicua]
MGLIDNMKNKISETMEGHDDSGVDSREHPRGASNTSGSKYGSEQDYEVPRTDRSGDRSGIGSNYNERSDDTYGVGFDSSSNKNQWGGSGEYDDELGGVGSGSGSGTGNVGFGGNDAAGRRGQGGYTRSGQDRRY